MITPKQALLQRSGAQYTPVTKASARAQSLARPQDLLGASPANTVNYTTSLAAGLQGPNAVRESAGLEIPGSTINALA